MDPELAIEALEEYEALLLEGRQIVRVRAEQFSYLPDSRFQEIESELNALVLIVERIFEECDEILAVQFKNHPRVRWVRASEIQLIEMLLGLLRARDREEAIFGEKGPRLAAASLHPWIWKSAMSLWESGHFADAVNRASTDLFDVRLPRKLGIEKVGGVDDRITKAFFPNLPTVSEPRLRFSGISPRTPDWTNAHEGAMYFGKGCAKGIPNVTAHCSEPTEQLALEALAALSLLARWIDEAEVELREPAV